MKAIILAAGMGTRLGKYTAGIPKGMLEFQGETLLSRQVRTLRAAGVEQIVIIRGYQAGKIEFKGATFYDNVNFDTTNMVASLFCAEAEFTEDLLICYGDIIYEKSVLDKVFASRAAGSSDVAVVVDSAYLPYWQKRLDDWQSDLESLTISDGRIVELGRPTRNEADAKVRYVGMIYFSVAGVAALKEAFHRNKKLHWDSATQWRNSKSFKQAYMTDMLQELIDSGVGVSPITIERGWLEFDTVEDYERAVSWAQDGSLSRFIEI